MDLNTTLRGLKVNVVRAYLRPSAKKQNATRAKAQLVAFAAKHGLKIAAFHIENKSGASLQRPALFELIADASPGISF